MRLQVLSDLRAWEAWAPAWNHLLARSATPVPFLRYEYLHLWWTRWSAHEWGPDRRLFVVLGLDARGHLAAAAPWFLTPDPAGGWVARGLGGDALTDYGDVLVPAEHSAAFWRALARHLAASGCCTALMLTHLPQTSPSLRVAEAAFAAVGWRVTAQVMETAPRIALPASWDAYVQALSKKQRHELRRKLRRAQRHDPPVRVYGVHTPEEVVRAAPRFLDLMAHNPRKAAFLTPATRAFFTALMHTAAQHGWLHLAFLQVGDRDAAAYLAFDFGRRLWIYNSGLDPAFAALSPGWVLAAHLIRRAIEHGYQVLDWLRGDEPYKYRLGGRDFFLYRLQARPGS